jgi:hypothetical protein
VSLEHEAVTRREARGPVHRRAAALSAALGVGSLLVAAGMVGFGGASAAHQSGSPDLVLAAAHDVRTMTLAVNSAAANAAPLPPTLPVGWSARRGLTSVQKGLAAQLSSRALNTQTSGTTRDLSAVDATDAKHVWAAGQTCTLLFSKGAGVWVKATGAPVGCAGDLRGISVLDATHGWAVGATGTVLVCKTSCTSAAAAWNRVVAPAMTSFLTFTAVAATSGKSVVVVGTTNTGHGQIWQCTANCTATTAGNAPAQAHWSNATPSSIGAVALTTVAKLADTTWVGGAQGAVLICTTPVCTPTSWSQLTAVSSGTPIPRAPTALTGITATTSNRLYASGVTGSNGALGGCNGSCANSAAGTTQGQAKWWRLTPPDLGATTLTAVAANGSNPAWTVGSGGAVWYCTDDDVNCASSYPSWMSMGRSTLTVVNLAAVTAAGPSRAWAVGAGGVIVAADLTSAPSTAINNSLIELNDTLPPRTWPTADGNHVSAAAGQGVFDDARDSTDALAVISPRPQWVSQADATIAGSLRLIATTAIADNSCSPQHPNEMTAANSELAAGDAAYGASQLDPALDHYGRARVHAIRAMGTSCGTGGITVNPTGPIFNVTHMVPGDTNAAAVTVQVTGSSGVVSFTESAAGSTTCAQNGLSCPPGVGTSTSFAHNLGFVITDATTGARYPATGSWPLDAIPTTRICGNGGGCPAWTAGESHQLSLNVGFPEQGAAVDNKFQGTGASATFVWSRS